MALKVTGFSATTLPYKIITETASTNSMNSNVTGTSGDAALASADDALVLVQWLESKRVS